MATNRWYFYGEVFFTTTQRRNNAGRRLDDYVANTPGVWAAEVWPLLTQVYGTWPAGRADITGTSDTGATVPGLRFCYATSDGAAAEQAMNDVVQNWARFEDTNSWWAYTLLTTP